MPSLPPHTRALTNTTIFMIIATLVPLQPVAGVETVKGPAGSDHSRLPVVATIANSVPGIKTTKANHKQGHQQQKPTLAPT